MESADELICRHLLDSARKASGDRREQFLLDASRKGDPRAYFILGFTYYYKYIGLKDRNRNPPSFINSYIAFPPERCYKYKLPEVDPFDDVFNSARHYLSLSITNGYPLAHGYLGKLYLERLDFESAIKHFEEFYNSGDEPAYHKLYDAIPFSFLSSAYYYGKHLPQSYENAFKWARRGAYDPTSQVIKGLCHLYGHGTEPNASRAQFSFGQFNAHIGDEIALSYSNYYSGYTYFYGSKSMDYFIDYDEEAEEILDYSEYPIIIDVFVAEPDKLEGENRLNCDFSYFKAAQNLIYSDLDCAKDLLLRCVIEGDILVDGEYEEELKSGGTLVAKFKEGYIRYFIPGPNRKTESAPDLRYNGDYMYIKSSEINEYIVAWRKNFKLYETLKSKPGNWTTLGEKDMVISSKNGVGLCKNSPIMVRTKSELTALLDDYIYARRKFGEMKLKIITSKRNPLYKRDEFDIWSILDKQSPSK